MVRRPRRAPEGSRARVDDPVFRPRRFPTGPVSFCAPSSAFLWRRRCDPSFPETPRPSGGGLLPAGGFCSADRLRCRRRRLTAGLPRSCQYTRGDSRCIPAQCAERRGLARRDGRARDRHESWTLQRRRRRRRAGEGGRRPACGAGGLGREAAGLRGQGAMSALSRPDQQLAAPVDELLAVQLPGDLAFARHEPAADAFVGPEAAMPGQRNHAAFVGIGA